MKKDGRSGVVAMPSSALLAGLALVLGLSTCAQVLSTRREVDLLHAHQLLELAALGAVEEAAARIEHAMPPVPYPPRGKMRERGLETYRYPSRVEAFQHSGIRSLEFT